MLVFYKAICRVGTDPGRPLNFKITFSRPGTSWNLVLVLESRGNSLKTSLFLNIFQCCVVEEQIDRPVQQLKNVLTVILSSS